MSYFKTLQGFKNFKTQEAFEKWQLDYPMNDIQSIQFLKNKVLFYSNTSPVYEEGCNRTEYGIFVTYTYQKEII